MPSIPHKLMIVTTTIEQTIQPCRIADQKGGIDGMYNIFLREKKKKRSKRKIKLQAVYSCKDSDEGVREFDDVLSACLDESSVAAFVSDC